jgi:hypothetical protein
MTRGGHPPCRTSFPESPPGRCGLLPDRVVDDPRQLRASLRRLLDLDYDTLLVGDGTCILAGARDRLHELLDSLPT